MVDFQSRDTHRGVDDEDDEEESEPTGESAGDETPEETTAGAESVTEDDGTGEFDPETLSYAVVTVTDDGDIEDDAALAAVVDAIEHGGDAVATRELIAASYDGIQSTVDTLADRDDVDAIVTLGGTGIAPDDVTVDAVVPLFDKRLPGFGELFRVLSHDVDGTAVVRTRTTAGIVDGVPVFCLPHDTAGARRGVEQIVLEEAPTIADKARTEP